MRRLFRIKTTTLYIIPFPHTAHRKHATRNGDHLRLERQAFRLRLQSCHRCGIHLHHPFAAPYENILTAPDNHHRQHHQPRPFTLLHPLSHTRLAPRRSLRPLLCLPFPPGCCFPLFLLPCQPLLHLLPGLLFCLSTLLRLPQGRLLTLPYFLFRPAFGQRLTFPLFHLPARLGLLTFPFRLSDCLRPLLRFPFRLASGCFGLCLLLRQPQPLFLTRCLQQVMHLQHHLGQRFLQLMRTQRKPCQWQIIRGRPLQLLQPGHRLPCARPHNHRDDPQAILLTTLQKSGNLLLGDKTGNEEITADQQNGDLGLRDRILDRRQPRLAQLDLAVIPDGKLAVLLQNLQLFLQLVLPGFVFVAVTDENIGHGDLNGISRRHRMITDQDESVSRDRGIVRQSTLTAKAPTALFKRLSLVQNPVQPLYCAVARCRASGVFRPKRARNCKAAS